MKVELIHNNLQNNLHIPKCLLCNNEVMSHHLLGSIPDNLTEIAGRVCYDSLKSPKTRNSHEYHKHINETGHSSVQGHYNFTVEISSEHQYSVQEDFCKMAVCLLNRPGIFTTYQHGDSKIRITCNLRAAIQWDKFTKKNSPINTILKCIIQNAAKFLAPLVFANVETKEEWNGYNWRIVPPVHEHETWFSFYIGDVSRGLTHELVRHGFQTAISQRSTRYVDESQSEWIWHPLISTWSHMFNMDILEEVKNLADQRYSTLVSRLEKILVDNNVDKFTARKQARGAARGILGNALSTELIWSCSLQELNEFLKQRASASADAEIRLLSNQMFEVVSTQFPGLLYYEKLPCPDGIGYELKRLS